MQEELKQEKLKAKEEAEDLTQEMAELRYKMTCSLDEERKRRVCIEQASLQRIAELEAQVVIMLCFLVFWSSMQKWNLTVLFFPLLLRSREIQRRPRPLKWCLFLGYEEV